MILKTVNVASERYFFGVKGLSVETNVFENKTELAKYINEEFDCIDTNLTLLNDFRLKDLDEKEINIFLKVLTFECDEGMICLYGLKKYYLMNDNGKTVETI